MLEFRAAGLVMTIIHFSLEAIYLFFIFKLIFHIL